MPLTEKGEQIKKSMEEQYGKEKGESVFYASKNKGTITGVDAMARETSRPFGAEDPVTKGESISGDQEYPTHERPLDPEPETEHPQKDPGESTPPEPATPGGDDLPPASTGDVFGDVADVNGGITGGAMPQSWGTPWKGPTGDALPTQCSLADMMRDGEKYWGQWTARPLGPDQK